MLPPSCTHMRAHAPHALRASRWRPALARVAPARGAPRPVLARHHTLVPATALTASLLRTPLLHMCPERCPCRDVAVIRRPPIATPLALPPTTPDPRPRRGAHGRRRT